jgi:hypothetical protein
MVKTGLRETRRPKARLTAEEEIFAEETLSGASAFIGVLLRMTSAQIPAQCPRMTRGHD